MLARLDSYGLKFSLAAATTSALLAVPAMGATVVDDSFADGDRAKTGALDSNWWTSSSSSGIEISTGSLGLVTGTSGRGIHTVFATQTLANVGDKLTATYTFMTPATVGSGGTSFRVGLFDTLGRAGLDADISASSSSPSPLYGDPSDPGTTPGLPGYMFDMDVNVGDGTEDLNFRDHDTASPSGRLMATTSGFPGFSSGPDEGYSFAPNTQYTGTFTIERIGATELQLSGTLGSLSYSVVDSSPDTFEFGFLGFHANSNVFGSTGSQNVPDNGIDFSNIKIEFEPVPEPGSLALLGLGGMALLSRRRKA